MGHSGAMWEIIAVTLKLRPEARTGNRDWRAISVQAEAAARMVGD